MSAMPKWAFVAFVKDEERFLPAFLDYHRSLGAERGYFFIDRSTDRTAEIVANCPWAAAMDAGFNPAREQMQAAQITCYDQALRMARTDGLDWLIMLDADEFLWGGADWPEPSSWLRRRRRSAAEEGNIGAMLAGVAPDVESIRIPPVEIIVESDGLMKPFWERQWFQDGRPVPRKVLDPRTGGMLSVERFLGHSAGKAFIRTTCDAQAFNAHKWTRRQDLALPDDIPLRTEDRGRMFHFLSIHAGHWRAKYEKLSHEPDTWLRGQPVTQTKQAWKAVASGMGEREAADYFRKWVALSPSAIRAGRRAGILKRATAVEDVLRECGFLGSADALRTGP